MRAPARVSSAGVWRSHPAAFKPGVWVSNKAWTVVKLFRKSSKVLTLVPFCLLTCLAISSPCAQALSWSVGVASRLSTINAVCVLASNQRRCPQVSKHCRQLSRSIRTSVQEPDTRFWPEIICRIRSSLTPIIPCPRTWDPLQRNTPSRSKIRSCWATSLGVKTAFTSNKFEITMLARCRLNIFIFTARTAA